MKLRRAEVLNKEKQERKEREKEERMTKRAKREEKAKELKEDRLKKNTEWFTEYDKYCRRELAEDGVDINLCPPEYEDWEKPENWLVFHLARMMRPAGHVWTPFVHEFVSVMNMYCELMKELDWQLIRVEFYRLVWAHRDAEFTCDDGLLFPVAYWQRRERMLGQLVERLLDRKYTPPCGRLDEYVTPTTSLGPLYFRPGPRNGHCEDDVLVPFYCSWCMQTVPAQELYELILLQEHPRYRYNVFSVKRAQWSIQNEPYLPGATLDGFCNSVRLLEPSLYAVERICQRCMLFVKEAAWRKTWEQKVLQEAIVEALKCLEVAYIILECVGSDTGFPTPAPSAAPPQAAAPCLWPSPESTRNWWTCPRRGDCCADVHPALEDLVRHPWMCADADTREVAPGFDNLYPSQIDRQQW